MLRYRSNDSTLIGVRLCVTGSNRRQHAAREGCSSGTAAQVCPSPRRGLRGAAHAICGRSQVPFAHQPRAAQEEAARRRMSSLATTCAASMARTASATGAQRPTRQHPRGVGEREDPECCRFRHARLRQLVLRRMTGATRSVSGRQARATGWIAGGSGRSNCESRRRQPAAHRRARRRRRRQPPRSATPSVASIRHHQHA